MTVKEKYAAGKQKLSNGGKKLKAGFIAGSVLFTSATLVAVNEHFNHTIGNLHNDFSNSMVFLHTDKKNDGDVFGLNLDLSSYFKENASNNNISSVKASEPNYKGNYNVRLTKSGDVEGVERLKAEANINLSEQFDIYRDGDKLVLVGNVEGGCDEVKKHRKSNGQKFECMPL